MTEEIAAKGQSDRSLVHNEGEPVWEIAHLFPAQGHWHEHENFAVDVTAVLQAAEEAN